MDYCHRKSSISRKVIRENNFTYYNLIRILRKYIKKDGDSLSVLDLGCGTGTMAFYLANNGHKVVGIDISKKAIKIAKESAGYLKLKGEARFSCKDIKKFETKQKFDLVICSEVLEHIKNDANVLKKIFRFLKKNSLLVISVPSKNAPLHKWGLTKEFDRRAGHLRRYSTEELKSKIENAGFKMIKIVKTEGLTRNALFVFDKLNSFIKFIKGPLVKLFIYIDEVFRLILGESNIYILAQKP